MTITVSLALYFTIWWTMLFTVLPFAGMRQAESGVVVPGTPASAPIKPQLLRLFAINTVVATLVFLLVRYVINERLITLDVATSPVR